MTQRNISLGNNVELIIDEPNAISANERALVVTSAILNLVSQSNSSLYPSTISGYLPIEIGRQIYQVYYQFKVRRIINTLNIYNDAIVHIQNNRHLYHPHLANQAIETLRECYRDALG